MTTPRKHLEKAEVQPQKIYSGTDLKSTFTIAGKSNLLQKQDLYEFLDMMKSYIPHHIAKTPMLSMEQMKPWLYSESLFLSNLPIKIPVNRNFYLIVFP